MSIDESHGYVNITRIFYILNNYFTLLNADIPSLDLACIQAYLPSSESTPTIYPYQVCKKLLNLNSFEACGPDNIPSRILKEFAHVFADPVTTIFNSSLVLGLVPALWKDSYITPIAKTPQPESESDIRPISLTAILSKVLEDRLCCIMDD